MSNMSYCRYENTLNDLRDCFADMRDRAAGEVELEPLSESEQDAMKELIKLCQMIVELDDKSDLDEYPIDVKFPYITVKLIGEDGNAFSIIGKVRQALERAGVSKDDVLDFQKEAMSGDYNHLLQTCMQWVRVEEE